MKEFKVFHESYLGDDCKFIMAYDHESAAEQYAENYDVYGEYDCVNGTTLELVVEGPDFIKKKFKVTGESVPLYTALEVKEKE